MNHLRLFGIPELSNASGELVRLRTRKQIALLTYLALEARTRPVSRDRLVELLWSDVSPAKARHSLSQALTALRGAFRGDVIRKVSESVLFVAPITTDLDLDDCTGLDVEHPLDDLDACAGAELAHWIDGVRQKCIQAIGAKLAHAIEQARLSGDTSAVHERAATLYQVDPLSDIAAQALAERFLITNDPAGARRFLKNHLERSQQEIGAIPHAGLKRLLQRIETGAPPHHPSAVEVPPPSLKSELFVGREKELGQLEALWATARRGSLQTCLLSGPAGIGKSSLLGRFAATVTARAFPSLLVSCQEIGAGIPFAVVADLIRELSRDPALGGADPMWLAEATRIYPALKATYPGIPEPPPAPPEAVRLRLAEALCRMLEAISEGGPVFIGLDDIQHLDPASRDVLHLVGRRLDGSPALLVATWRTLGAQVPADALSTPVPWRVSLDVGPLGDAFVVRILTKDDRGSDDGIHREIATLAQGNPYFAELLLSDWQHHASRSLAATVMAGDTAAAFWRPPETMRLAFARQFESMLPETRDTLDLLAVAGRAMANGEIADLLGWSTSRVDQALLPLTQRGVVRFERGAIAFKNELHRAFVYYAMTDESRRLQHARIARWQGAHGEDFQRDFEATHHFVRAGMFQEAAATVEHGATRGISSGAPSEAEKALRSVMSASEPGANRELLLLLAQALEAQGKHREVLEILGRVADSPDHRVDVAMAAILRAKALRLGRLAGDRAIADAAKRAVAAARLARDDLASVEALQVHAEVAADASDQATLRWAANRSRKIGLATSQPRTRALAELTRAYSLMVGGNLSEARAAFQTSADELGSMSLHTERRRALNGLGMCCTGLGQFTEALTAFDEGYFIAERTGDSFVMAVFKINLAAVLQDTGFFRKAADCYAAAMHLSESSRAPRARAFLYAPAASLATKLGNYEQAQKFVDLAEIESRKAGVWAFEIGALIPKAELLLARGEDELAWQVAEEAIKRTSGRTCPTAEWVGLERLRRHWILATKGYGALIEERRATTLGLSIVERLEIAALEEWATTQEDMPTSDQTGVMRELQARGLFGVMAKLSALHVPPRGLPNTTEGVSSAQLVGELFPDVARGVPPLAVPVGQ